jgi:hemerythrin superfamily protein
MDAIKLLTQQHRRFEKLFEQFEASDDESEKEDLFDEIADILAVHAIIEERYFYPMVRARDTEQQVEESYGEHLEIKKLILEAMKSSGDLGFADKVEELRGAVEHHVEEEEGDLFPKVKKSINSDALDLIGDQMESEADRLLAAGDPRKNVREESEPPAIHP